MHAASPQAWDIRLEFETAEPSWPDQIDNFAEALRRNHTGTSASLTDNGTSITTGGTITVTAASLGSAVDTAVSIFRQVAQTCAITLTRLREAEAHPADLDLRS